MLYTIAADIIAHWPNPYFGAVPYINAMERMALVKDKYMYEDGKSIVLYFLSNASSWRGEDARRIKTELKLMIKE